jgi:hypothetical protein
MSVSPHAIAQRPQECLGPTRDQFDGSADQARGRNARARIRITSLPRADQYSVAVDIGGASGRGPLDVPGRGIQTTLDGLCITAFGRRALDLRKRGRRTGEFDVRGEYVRKFGCTPPCWPDCRPR